MDLFASVEISSIWLYIFSYPLGSNTLGLSIMEKYYAITQFNCDTAIKCINKIFHFLSYSLPVPLAIQTLTHHNIHKFIVSLRYSLLLSP